MRYLCYVFLFLSLFIVDVNSQLPIDENGWTVITPSLDSRIIYVSSSEGSDDNDGLSEETPVNSISKAISLARDGYPDHLLFKRGDEWFTEFGLGSFKSGRSATQPMVVSYYGDSGPRPKFNLGSSFMSTFNLGRSHLAFIGLMWYGYKHDPTSPDFNSDEGVSVFGYLGYGDNILVEDCVAEYASLGAFSPADMANYYRNVKFRRLIICNAYGPESYYFHELRNRVQGVYVHNTEGFLVEDCLFDHNGWNEIVDGSGANMFNHNIYMSGHNPDPTKIILRNNILARGAAHGIQLRSGGSATGNVFIQNAVHINIGFNYIEEEWYDMLDDVAKIENTTVSDNVMLETRLMDSTNILYPRTAARIGIGAISIPCRISDNIIAHSINKDGTAIYDYEDLNSIGGKAEMENNIVYKFYKNRDLETEDPGWFDPERNIRDYHRRLRKEGTTIAFLEAAKKRPLKVWWPEYSADSLIRYIKNGFSFMEDIKAPETPGSLIANKITDASVDLSWSWAVDNQRTLGYKIYVNGSIYNQKLIRDTTYSIFQLSSENEYTIAVTAVDVSGNESDAKELVIQTLSQDSSPPSAPGSLKVTEVTDHSFSVFWPPATDNMTVWGYRIYLDAVLQNEEIVQDTSYTINNLSMGETYQVEVSAVDAGGNESSRTSPESVRVLDSEDPSMPENVFLSEFTSGGFTLSWDSASDNVAVIGYYIYINNVILDSTENLSYVINGLETGESIRVSVSAYDFDGNESRTSKPIEIIMSNSNLQTHPMLEIYPNPAKDKLVVSSTGMIHGIEIININGNIVYTGKPEKENLCEVNIRNLSSGTYIIKITKDKDCYTKRFVKR